MTVLAITIVVAKVTSAITMTAMIRHGVHRASQPSQQRVSTGNPCCIGSAATWEGKQSSRQQLPGRPEAWVLLR
eukprot:8619538-Alexandrium_andersonii.AAC.1